MIKLQQFAKESMRNFGPILQILPYLQQLKTTANAQNALCTQLVGRTVLSVWFLGL